MNARTLTPELQRSAAQARIRSAKDAFTRATVDVLYNRPGAATRADAALSELKAAQAGLAMIDAEQEAHE